MQIITSGQPLGEFEVLSVLGEGGTGEVCRACDGQLGREVVLRLLPSDLAADPARHARFEREARVLAGVDDNEQLSPSLDLVAGWTESLRFR